MRNQILLLIGLILATFLVACSENRQAIDQLVEIGQEKQEIIKVIGEPAEKEIITKQNESIWGSEEEFWSEIPMGTSLEVWSYEDEQGQLNLYFVEGSNRLGYKAFAPKGVVY